MKSIIALSVAACALTLPAANCIAADSAIGLYELKHRSAFHVDGDARIPFWPIGFQRPKPGSPVQSAFQEAPKATLLPEHFNLTSVLLGNPALAMINGRSFGEGEMLPVTYGTTRMRVMVKSIRDGGVWLDHEGQQIFVPLKRPEIGQRPAQQRAEPVEFAIKIPGAGPEK